MFSLIEPELKEFEGRLAKELKSSVEFIEAIGDNLAAAGGKRLRPSLAFLAGHLLHAQVEDSMRVALAVELLHSASLLHDDLIDDAETRRGREAAFRRYGNIVSVMAGDYLLAKVLGILASTDNAKLTQLLSSTAAAICEGEVLQFQMATLETFSYDNYLKIIEGKTAALFAAAFEGVAILAKASTKQHQALRNFALAYGRAFQIQDDYLDLFGTEASLGKPVGGDLREGKATLPVLLLLDQEEEAKKILRRHASGPQDIDLIISLAKEYGTDKKTQDKITQEANNAISALDVFPESKVKSMLIELASREITRLK